jgi:hypothetical protein
MKIKRDKKGYPFMMKVDAIMSKPRKRAKSYVAITVPFTAIPIVEPPAIGQWASFAVWTESMLTTLLEAKGERRNTSPIWVSIACKKPMFGSFSP